MAKLVQPAYQIASARFDVLGWAQLESFRQDRFGSGTIAHLEICHPQVI
jgi:hypothetical protein